jgi:hypothetical protein
MPQTHTSVITMQAVSSRHGTGRSWAKCVHWSGGGVDDRANAKALTRRSGARDAERGSQPSGTA